MLDWSLASEEVPEDELEDFLGQEVGLYTAFEGLWEARSRVRTKIWLSYTSNLIRRGSRGSDSRLAAVRGCASPSASWRSTAWCRRGEKASGPETQHGAQGQRHEGVQG